MILFPIMVGIVTVIVSSLLFACLKRNRTNPILSASNSEEYIGEGTVKTNCVIKGFAM